MVKIYFKKIFIIYFYLTPVFRYSIFQNNRVNSRLCFSYRYKLHESLRMFQWKLNQNLNLNYFHLKHLNTMKNLYLKIVYIFIFIGHLYFKYFNKNWARILDLQFISPYFLNFYQIKLCYFFMNNYYILKGLIVIWEIFFIYQNLYKCYLFCIKLYIFNFLRQDLLNNHLFV